MESSLFIAVQPPTPEHKTQLLLMLSDDAPVFEEEVAPKWRELFNALEELTLPDDVLNIQNGTVSMSWICGYWDDAFNDHSASLNKAGFSKQAAYYWADEKNIQHIKYDSRDQWPVGNTRRFIGLL